MKVGVIGLTAEGLSLASALALAGFETRLYAPDEEECESILEGKLPVYEEGLHKLLSRARESGNFRFVYRMEALFPARVVFLCERRVPDEDLATALRFFKQDLVSLIQKADGEADLVAVTKLLPGSYTYLSDEIETIQSSLEDKKKIAFSIIPCTARPGQIARWMKRPSPALIGTENPKSAGLIREILRKMGAARKQIMVTSPEEVEEALWLYEEILLGLKLFANDADELGIRPMIRRMMSLTGFPRPGLLASAEDLELLGQSGELYRIKDPGETVRAQNSALIEMMVREVKEALTGFEEKEEKTVLVTGLSQYPGSGDMRGASQVDLIAQLAALPIKIHIYMDEGAEDLKWRVREHSEKIFYKKQLKEAFKDVQVVLVAGTFKKAGHLRKLIQKSENRPGLVDPFGALKE